MSFDAEWNSASNEYKISDFGREDTAHFMTFLWQQKKVTKQKKVIFRVFSWGKKFEKLFFLINTFGRQFFFTLVFSHESCFKRLPRTWFTQKHHAHAQHSNTSRFFCAYIARTFLLWWVKILKKYTTTRPRIVKLTFGVYSFRGVTTIIFNVK